MYTLTEKDLLSIVENIEEFRNILLGQILRIYTNNKNLTCKTFNNNRELGRRLILEDYVPDIEYIKCEKDIFADALSRLPFNGNQGTT